jgi:hypothetical protein
MKYQHNFGLTVASIQRLVENETENKKDEIERVFLEWFILLLTLTD